MRFSTAAVAAACLLAAPALVPAFAQMDLRPKAGAAPAAPASAGGDSACADKPSVERINAYFNGVSGMIADFAQTAPDGRRFDGKLYIQRPGKMKFEYNPPSPLEIISDGRTVAVRDKKAGTQDDYLVGQTPLKFLLRDRIDVSRDSKVVSLNQQGNEAILLLEDRQTVGGTSRIRITFDNCSNALKGWVVTDPQGYNTRIVLTNISTGVRPSASLFVIPTKVTTPN